MKPSCQLLAGGSLLPPRPTVRILHADDDECIRTLVSMILLRSGYTVVEAQDGLAAWASIAQNHFHLLILDEQMPGLTGLELVRQTRLAGLDTPIIMASASVLPRDIETMPELRIDAAVPKPFRGAELVSTVQQVLLAHHVTSPDLTQLRARSEPSMAVAHWGICE